MTATPVLQQHASSLVWMDGLVQVQSNERADRTAAEESAQACRRGRVGQERAEQGDVREVPPGGTPVEQMAG
jgi:hypothetical protein